MSIPKVNWRGSLFENWLKQVADKASGRRGALRIRSFGKWDLVYGHEHTLMVYKADGKRSRYVISKPLAVKESVPVFEAAAQVCGGELK